MISFRGIWRVVVCFGARFWKGENSSARVAEDVRIGDIVVFPTAVDLRVVGVVVYRVLRRIFLIWRLIIVSKITRFMALRNGLRKLAIVIAENGYIILIILIFSAIVILTVI